MHISVMFEAKRAVISFEIFPPKKDGDMASIYKTIEEVAPLGPDFISVTHGAGGNGGKNTLEVASHIKNNYGIEALPHLTCITSSKETIRHQLDSLERNGIENILALRGDLPPKGSLLNKGDYQYGEELIGDIKEYGRFCVGAATYPEGHIECIDEETDLEYLKKKVNRGADFLISQLFFDNEIFYKFKRRMDEAKINCKLSAGIMPIISKGQIEKIIYMCGASLPSKVIKLLVKYERRPELLKQAGIEYAAEQAIDLLKNKVNGIHIYTMNQSSIPKGIVNLINQEGISKKREILG